MSGEKSALFGTIQLIRGDSVYQTVELSVNGRVSTCSLSIDEGLSAESQRLDTVLLLIDNLAALDLKARAEIEQALVEGNAIVSDFISDHHQEMPRASLRELGLIGLPRSAFLSRLSLCGVNVRSNADTFHLVVDYSVGRAYSDQLLCVYIDEQGMPYRISHES